jgi:PEP-CTERM motif
MAKTKLILTILAVEAMTHAVASQANALTFTPGDIVVSVEGAGVTTGTTFTDNQAAPLTLEQFAVNGTSSASAAGSLVLPQTSSVVNGVHNSAISGEYGSSSEGTLQLSGNGQFLTIAGYGVNAATFNANPGSFSISPTNTALGQSSSTAVPRVIALIGADGSVDTSTALTNVFNGNNPRSVYTVNGTSFYISGQGTSPDSTGGVFFATKGATTATPITGNDTSGGTASQDTRDVQIVNGQLVVSVDSKGGSNNARSFIGTLGAQGNPPTTLANNGNGPTQLTGFGSSATGKQTITAATTNGINSAGQQINLSPENFFFANATTLYVADSGNSKQNSANSSLGDGGLQKWSLVNGSWTLDYTVAAGLNLVANTAASGTTGLYGLTGQVVNGQVQLFATNFTIGDTDPTFLFGLTDNLAATTKAAGEAFTELEAAPADSTFKGVSFAPAAPEPSTWVMMILGFAGIGFATFRKKSKPALLAA